jgi:hypothetical protein
MAYTYTCGDPVHTISQAELRLRSQLEIIDPPIITATSKRNKAKSDQQRDKHNDTLTILMKIKQTLIHICYEFMDENDQLNIELRLINLATSKAPRPEADTLEGYALMRSCIASDDTKPSGYDRREFAIARRWLRYRNFNASGKAAQDGE